MKMLGPRSMSSWLRRALGFVSGLLWAGIALLPAVVVIALVIRVFRRPTDTTSGDIRINGAEMDAFQWPDAVGGLVALCIALPLAILILRRLKAMLDSFVASDPFRAENGDHLSTIGFAMIGLQFVNASAYCIAFVLRLIAQMPLGPIKINLDFDGNTLALWFLIAVLFVLAEVFREGARMRDEQNLTV